MNRNTLLLVGVFTLGGAMGLFASSRAHAAAPGASASQNGSTDCWSYDGVKSLNDELDDNPRLRGAEMVGLTALPTGKLVACFKRSTAF